jgi:hypothetical protein
MADFTFEVTAWVNKAKHRADAVFRAVAMDAVNRVKELTPVDTGFLRSNWTVIRKGDEEPVAGRVPDAAHMVMTARIGDVLVILNPTTYARRIEYGFVGEDKAGRHYSQAGHHMVQQTITELPQIAERALQRIAG